MNLWEIIVANISWFKNMVGILTEAVYRAKKAMTGLERF